MGENVDRYACDGCHFISHETLRSLPEWVRLEVQVRGQWLSKGYLLKPVNLQGMSPQRKQKLYEKAVPVTMDDIVF